MSVSRRPFPLHAGVATVQEATLVTPTMRVFRLADPAFTDPGIEQPGEIITLGFAEDGEELALPQLGWRFPAGAPEQHWRNFTVRAWDTATATIDVEFFLHGDHGAAAGWGLRAQVGDRVGFGGPRTHYEPDPEAQWTLLVADETGLPALLAIVESLPTGHPTIVVAEITDAAERREVETSARVEWHWLERDGHAPGTTRLLLDAVTALELPSARGQAWGGGEALAIRDVRRHLQAFCPQLSGAMSLLGYWKHDASPDDVD